MGDIYPLMVPGKRIGKDLEKQIANALMGDILMDGYGTVSHKTILRGSDRQRDLGGLLSLALRKAILKGVTIHYRQSIFNLLFGKNMASMIWAYYDKKWNKNMLHVLNMYVNRKSTLEQRFHFYNALIDVAQVKSANKIWVDKYFSSYGGRNQLGILLKIKGYELQRDDSMEQIYVRKEPWRKDENLDKILDNTKIIGN